ncbi:MAG: carbohydrate ABC transporter permease [Herpetosiphonaceae bacterium]|nr:carbohydrate ABC transporter permease [Herpetosiphonaceae bacterium]
MIEKSNWGDRLLAFVSYVVVAGFAVMCIFPFWIMVVASLTNENSLTLNGYLPWTTDWSLSAYKWVLAGKEIQASYLASLARTVIGTTGSLLVMSGLAYMMAAKRFKWRGIVAMYTFFAIIFVPSIIPWFITTRNVLRLYDSLPALMLPMMVQPFWVFVLRNFFAQLPAELSDAAYIDGASDVTILFRIVLPLSGPVLATVGLFMAVTYWNDWFLPVMLIDRATQLRPLPVIILRMVNNMQAIAEAMKQPGTFVPLAQLPANAIRMATACVIIGPIVFVYPFVQRYFVKGLTMGSVKG